MCDVTRSTQQHNIGRLASLPGSVDITKSKIFKELKVVQICQPAEQSLSEGSEKKWYIPQFSKDSAYCEKCLAVSKIYDCKHKSPFDFKSMIVYLSSDHYLALSVTRSSQLAPRNRYCHCIVRRQISENIFAPNGGHCS